MPDTTPLSSALEDMRSRHYRIPAPHTDGAGICASDRHKWPCHAHVLGGAVAAVLEIHSLTAYHWHAEPCPRHRMHGRAKPGDCSDCKVVEWTGCDRCRDENGDPARPEECRERAAITRELLGGGE